MMKTRIAVILLSSLVILAALVSFFARDKKEPVQVFQATVNRDCAPWDGSAFTVKIPIEGGEVIDISIWQSPDIKFPKTFSFPDDSGQVGNAILIYQTGLPDVLTGDVWFQSVGEEMPLEGRFKLKTEGGGVYVGQFKAQWENQIALCG
jgi:hypothetical protein